MVVVMSRRLLLLLLLLLLPTCSCRRAPSRGRLGSSCVPVFVTTACSAFTTRFPTPGTLVCMPSIDFEV